MFICLYNDDFLSFFMCRLRPLRWSSHNNKTCAIDIWIVLNNLYYFLITVDKKWKKNQWCISYCAIKNKLMCFDKIKQNCFVRCRLKFRRRKTCEYRPLCYKKAFMLNAKLILCYYLIMILWAAVKVIYAKVFRVLLVKTLTTFNL